MYKYKNHPQNIKIVVFNEKHFRIWHHPIKTPRKEKTVAEGGMGIVRLGCVLL